MSDLRKEVDDFFEKGKEEFIAMMQKVAEQATQLNVENGNYTDRTGNLRQSNYGFADETGIEIGNHADYASFVSSKGFDVIDSGVRFLQETLSME